MKINTLEVKASNNLYFLILVDGNWGEWSEWSTCTKTCKQGKQSRTRECNLPAPRHGGKKCEGQAQESQVCNDKVPCPGAIRLSKTSSNYHFRYYSNDNSFMVLHRKNVLRNSSP